MSNAGSEARDGFVAANKPLIFKVAKAHISGSLCEKAAMQIKDKIAIVTGASAGIGLALARLLAEKGATVTRESRCPKGGPFPVLLHVL